MMKASSGHVVDVNADTGSITIRNGNGVERSVSKDQLIGKRINDKMAWALRVVEPRG